MQKKTTKKCKDFENLQNCNNNFKIKVMLFNVMCQSKYMKMSNNFWGGEHHGHPSK